MNKISVKHFANIAQGEFEEMPIKEQYDLIEQLFMLFVHSAPALAVQVQPGIDSRCTAWRQYEYLRRIGRENGVIK